MTAAPAAVAERAVTCPRCGGAPDPAGGSGRLARCRSCGVLGRIHDPDGRQRLAALPAIDRGFAMQALRDHAADQGGGKLSIRGCELVFVPYWRLHSVIVGHVKGERRRVRKTLERITGDNGQSFYQWIERDDGSEPVTRDVERHHVALVAACPLDEYGIPTLDRFRQGAGRLGVKRPLHRLGEVVPFQPSLRQLGSVLDPIVTGARADAEADALVDQQRKGFAGDLLPGARVDATVIARDRMLLFYPVYVLRCERGGAAGRAVVDGISGHVVSLRGAGPSEAPQDRRLFSLAGLAAGLLAGSLVQLALAPAPWLAGVEARGLRFGLLLVAAGLLAGAWLGGRELAKLLARGPR
jgi:hypothetical protein